jgi:hypothetical protein
MRRAGGDAGVVPALEGGEQESAAHERCVLHDSTGADQVAPPLAAAPLGPPGRQCRIGAGAGAAGQRCEEAVDADQVRQVLAVGEGVAL